MSGPQEQGGRGILSWSNDASRQYGLERSRRQVVELSDFLGQSPTSP